MPDVTAVAKIVPIRTGRRRGAYAHILRTTNGKKVPSTLLVPDPQDAGHRY
jgi:hypothetical protein